MTIYFWWGVMAACNIVCLVGWGFTIWWSWRLARKLAEYRALVRAFYDQAAPGPERVIDLAQKMAGVHHGQDKWWPV